MGITQARTWGKAIGSVIFILVTMLPAVQSRPRRRRAHRTIPTHQRSVA